MSSFLKIAILLKINDLMFALTTFKAHFVPFETASDTLLGGVYRLTTFRTFSNIRRFEGHFLASKSSNCFSKAY